MAIRNSAERRNYLSAIKRRLDAERQLLRARFRKSGNVQDFLRQQRVLVDCVLKEVWRHLVVPSGAALLAVGGYGRGELFPFSDVDILVLLPHSPSAELAKKLEELIGCFWDTGLEVGHSVRNLAECIEEAKKDITVQTSLIEARLIVGSRALFLRFRDATRSAVVPQTFFNAKRLEQEQRHAKYQDTPFSLEPNLKEAPGGLRDLQVILWIGQAAGLGGTWQELAHKGFVTTAEARALARDERLLKQLRVMLHLAAGRREDRLLFDYQNQLAQELGYRATAHRRASELLMETYYRTAKSVTQLNTILLQNLHLAVMQDPATDCEILDEDFQITREMLDARTPGIFERDPSAILKSILLLQQRSELKGMTATTLRALWRSRTLINRDFRNDPKNRVLFLNILQQPRGLIHALRRMNQYSLLGRYLPAFGRIVGQMQHDLFHVYTVDQHILTVVRNLRRFTMLEFAHEYPQCSRLIAGFERHWLLYVAAMYHDIAKGRGGDHSTLGRLEARKFCRDHGLDREDSDLVEFLVQHHLLMSSVAQKQDLSDPVVVRQFLAIVKTERRLVALYLLTVADIRGTSPKVWNAWKAKLLEELFSATLRSLSGTPILLAEAIQEKQEEAKRLLRLYALSDGVEMELWKRLDIPYFLRHDAQEIAWQTRLLFNRIDSAKSIVKARLSPAGEGLQVMIYTQDQPHLFARICGFFGAIAYSIVDAKIHTTRHGYALDTFQVMGIGRSSDYRDMIRLVEYELQATLDSRTPLQQPGKGRVSRQLKHFPITPEVNIRPDEKGQYHLLTITAGDRPGLLFAIARILGEYHANLHTAKIATLGDRAEDTFLVSGDALSHPQTVLLLEQDLLLALQ